MADIFGAGVAGAQIVGNLLSPIFNNAISQNREQMARIENYEYSEKAANAADLRTRNLYTDLYSPQAQLQQVKDAGISPSIYYGDIAGISGQTGAQGNGAAGVNPTTYGMTPIDMAQLAKLSAEKENIEADTAQKKADTKGQNIENAIKELTQKTKSAQFDILQLTATDENGNPTSLQEMAENSNSYYDFLKTVRTSLEKSGRNWENAISTTEIGSETLRTIYYETKKLNKEIAVLNNDQTSAEFEQSVTECLKDSDFANLNAQEAVEALKSKVAVESLTEVQKDAWNKVLEAFTDPHGENKTNWRDILIVLGMIFNNAMTNYKH